MVASLVKKQQTNEDGKEEVWSRLNELSNFALVGFGFFTATVGTGTYNRERKSTVLRHATADRDALWDIGVRVPVGNRFCQASAALTWGCLHEAHPAEDIVLLAGCHPRSQALYDASEPTGKKLEPHGKPPGTLGQFLRCTKQHFGIWCLLLGSEHREERLHATHTPEQLREAHPDLFPIQTIASGW